MKKILTLLLLVVSTSAIAVAPAVKMSGTGSTATTVSTGKTMWGWQNGEVCQGLKKEIQYNVAMNKWLCVANPKITKVK